MIWAEVLYRVRNTGRNGEKKELFTQHSHQKRPGSRWAERNRGSSPSRRTRGDTEQSSGLSSGIMLPKVQISALHPLSLCDLGFPVSAMSLLTVLAVLALRSR